MQREVILHATVSLDSKLTGFPIDSGLHYEVVGAFQAGVHLIGSNAALTVMESLGGLEAARGMEDAGPPEAQEGDARPLWVVIDSKGLLEGKLHALRHSGYCREVAVAICHATPRSYIRYLRDRSHPHIISGDKRVDLPSALELIFAEFGASRILVDSGPALAGALIDRGLVNRISLLVAPYLVGGNGKGMFEAVKRVASLRHARRNLLRDQHVHIEYDVVSRHARLDSNQ